MAGRGAISTGRIVHPQFWPEDLDYAGKKVAVIGSGATAVTLVPALAETAAHVTMVQRSPSYIVARPSRDAIARWLQRWLPRRAADAAIRWKNVLLDDLLLSARAQAAGAGRAAGSRELDRARSCRPATTSSAISRPLQAVGPAPLPGPRRRPVRGDARRQGARSSPARSSASRRAGLQLASGERARRRTSSSPPPASS